MRILAVFAILAAIAAADSSKPAPVFNDAARPAAAQSAASVRVEGEKRFRTNCGRCHMSPHKFPPRMMATIVRHMRVRALITDDDMRYILAYMTE
jgi:mono/diheme cytochrome c family protein